MNIIQVNHQFKNLPRKRTATKRIIIHHAASNGDVSAATIHQWHLTRGWAGCGYHFVIRFNGNIESGRQLDLVGAHAGETANHDSIGVCLTGDFEKHQPTETQINSLVWLIRYLFDKYGKLTIHEHREFMSTSCAGRFFNLEHVKQLVSKGDIQPKLIVNGKQTTVPIRLIDGRIQIQVSGSWIVLRDFANSMFGELQWDEGTRTAYLNFR